jgi:NTP pyrophosphatase (non-canonical NTP hydrolase)
MNDSDTTLSELRELVREFRDRREWGRFHTPKNLSMAIAVEAAELMEQFQWLAQDEAWALAEDAGRLKLIGEELADILIYALSFAEALHLDVATAVVDKLARNAKKYPEDDNCGRASWLDRINGGDA